MHNPRTRPALAAALAATCFAASVISLDAFGAAGHRIVGLLAELDLKDSRALRQVRRILPKDHTLADAAVWPDTIKDSMYEDADSAIYKLNHPAHDTYHYANLPFQAERYGLDVPGARPTDIIQITRESIRVLKTGKGMFKEREALRLLAHFIGDMHQPLHAGNGFVSSSGPLTFVEPKGPTGWRPTLGGNLLLYGPENRFNLHSYWDSHAVNITIQKDDPAAFAARLFAEGNRPAGGTPSGDPVAWPELWATEVLVHAKEVHRGLRIVSYLGPDEAKRTPHRWLIEQPSDYDQRARTLVRRQLAAGGFRLAAVLKAIWPD